VITRDIDALYDHRSEPDARSVLEDLQLEEGARSTRLGLALWFIHAVGGDVVVGVVASVVGGDAGDDAADDDAGDAADAVGGDGGRDADAWRNITSLINKEPDMKDGLKIIRVTGAYYGYAVTKIAWIRRIVGDEWEMMPGARTIIRTGSPRTLDSLAAHGPRKDHTLTDPAIGSEELNRLMIRRSLPADEIAWGDLCPRPVGWVEAES
jgi:hypothetical protein